MQTVLYPKIITNEKYKKKFNNCYVFSPLKSSAEYSWIRLKRTDNTGRRESHSIHRMPCDGYTSTFSTVDERQTTASRLSLQEHPGSSTFIENKNDQ